MLRAAGLVVLTVVLAGCSGTARDLPDPGDFAAGTCRQAAPAVRAVDEAAREAIADDARPATVRDALQTGQEQLQGLEASAVTDGVADELTELVTRIGFARAALDTDSFSEPVGEAVSTAVDGLIARCVPADS